MEEETFIQFFNGFKSLFENHYSVRFNNLKKSTENLISAIKDHNNLNLALDQVQTWFKEFLFLKEFQNHIYFGEISHIYFNNLLEKLVGNKLEFISPDFTGSFNSNCNSDANYPLSCLSYSYFYTVGYVLIPKYKKNIEYKKQMKIISIEFEGLSAKVNDTLKPLNNLLKSVEENLFKAASFDYHTSSCAMYPNEKLQLPLNFFPKSPPYLTRSKHGGDLIKNVNILDNSSLLPTASSSSSSFASRVTTKGVKKVTEDQTPLLPVVIARKKKRVIEDDDEEEDEIIPASSSFDCSVAATSQQQPESNISSANNTIAAPVFEEATRKGPLQQFSSSSSSPPLLNFSSSEKEVEEEDEGGKSKYYDDEEFPKITEEALTECDKKTPARKKMKINNEEEQKSPESKHSSPPPTAMLLHFSAANNNNNNNNNETSVTNEENFPPSSKKKEVDNNSPEETKNNNTLSSTSSLVALQPFPPSSSFFATLASQISNVISSTTTIIPSQEHFYSAAGDNCDEINSDSFLQSLEDHFHHEHHQQSYSIDNLMLDVVKCIKNFNQNISNINCLFTIFILKSFSNDGDCIDFSSVSLIEWFRSKLNVFQTLLKVNWIYSLNTEQYTNDEIVWFSFYNSNFIYKPQNAKYLKKDEMDLVLGKTNCIKKNQLLNNYKTSHDEIESLVKKFKLKDALKIMSDNDQVKYKMTEAEIFKYLKLSEIFDSAENMITKSATKNLLENAFNEAVKFVIKINMALNMNQIQTNLLTEEYTELNHGQVLNLVVVVHKFFGEVAAKTIKSLNCFKLRNDVLDSSKEIKKFVDSKIKKTVLNVVLPKRIDEENKRVRKPTSHFSPPSNSCNNNRSSKNKKHISAALHISFDEDADNDKLTDEEEEVEGKKKKTVKKNYNKKEVVVVEDGGDLELKDNTIIINNNKKGIDDDDVRSSSSTTTSLSGIINNKEQINSSEVLWQLINQFFDPNKIKDYKYLTNVTFCILMSKAQHLNKSKCYFDMDENTSNYVTTVLYYVKNIIDSTTTEEHNFTQTQIESFRNDNDLSINGTNDMIWEAFSNLYRNEWLSDNVISLYCEMLNARELSLWKLYPNRKKSFFIDMWLIDKLRRNGGCTWYNKLNIFKFDFLFICINILNTHWSLVRVSIKNRTIEYIDSLHTCCSLDIKNNDLVCIEKWLIFEQKHHDHDRSCTSGTARWSKTIVQNNPQQLNGYDCGIFMLISAYFLADFESFESYNTKIMDQGRQKIAIDLYMGYIVDPRINDVNEYYFVYQSTEFIKELTDERKKQLIFYDDGDSSLISPIKWIRLFFNQQQTPPLLSSDTTTNTTTTNIIRDDDSDEEDKEKYITILASTTTIPKQNLYVSTYQAKKIRALESENKILKEKMDELMLKLSNTMITNK
jgi:hypothetical protein